MITDMKNNRRLLVCIIIFSVLLAAPILFLEQETPSGICGILGLLFFMIAERTAGTKRELRFVLLAFSLSLSIRFSRVFGPGIFSFLIVLLLFVLFCVLIGIGIMAERMLFGKNLPIAAILIVPLFYSAAILLFVTGNTGNLHNLTTYCMCSPLLFGNLRYICEYGMTFLIMLVLSLAALTVTADRTKLRIGAAVGAAVMAAALLISGASLKPEERVPDYTLNVALGLCEKTDFLGNTDRKYTKEDHAEIFRRAVESAAENNADLLVLNEEFYTVEKGDEDYAMKSVSETIKEFGIPSLVCFDMLGTKEEKGINKAVFYGSDGNILMTYEKHNLVPLIESSGYKSGEDAPGHITYDFDGHEVNISLVICFDINDDAYIRKIPDDTELLLVPSWDWDNCNIEQRRTFIRSVECDTTLLKHSYEGFTYVSTPFGVYGDILDNRGVYEAVRMMEIPIYEKTGC